MTQGFLVDGGPCAPENEKMERVTNGPAGASPNRWIYAVGGGDRPQEGLRRAVAQARAAFGPAVRALVIAYASEHPETYEHSFGEQLRLEGVPPPDALLRGPACPDGIADAARRIREAHLICLSGGDQNVAMESFRIPELREALIGRYQAGAPLIATSAGAAMLSRRMLTGEGAATGEGLGLLEGLVMEQHFVTCGRAPRVVELLSSGTVDLVVGPDEDAMLEIRDERHAEVIGEHYVFLFERRESGIHWSALSPGETLDLAARGRARTGWDSSQAAALTRRTRGAMRDEADGW